MDVGEVWIGCAWGVVWMWCGFCVNAGRCGVDVVWMWMMRVG